MTNDAAQGASLAGMRGLPQRTPSWIAQGPSPGAVSPPTRREKNR